MTINSVSAQSKTAFAGIETQKEQTKVTNSGSKIDTVEIKNNEEPPEISNTRLIFGTLKDEQINQINKSKKLPHNGKFVPNGYGGYRIAANFINLTIGTRKLPEGFEVRKDVMGFACVLPIDSSGLFIKKKNEE